jgi:hypothetical protein
VPFTVIFFDHTAVPTPLKTEDSKTSRMDPERLAQLPVDSRGQPMLEMARSKAKREKAIPKDYKSLIPSDAMSISSLLNTPLPTILSTASTLRPAKSCLVSEPPSWTEDELKTMRVPSKEWLDGLDGAIVEGWLNGAHSVEHPSDATVRFPLWVGTFWMSLLEVIREREEWRRSREWMLSLTQGAETHETLATFDRVPWKKHVWILPVEADRAVTKLSFFARLLSDGLLAERHIDAFASYLNIRLRKRAPKAPGVFVASLPLSVTLSIYFDAPAWKIQECKLLLQYTALFRNRAYHRLLFPAHVGGALNGHWVVFDVDFKNSKYSFGELDGRTDTFIACQSSR